MDPLDTFVGSNGETSTKVLNSKIVATGQRITLTHDSDKYWKRILLSENDPLGVSQKATVVPYGVVLTEYFLNASSGFYRIDSGTNYTNDMGFDPGMWYDILVTAHETTQFKSILAISRDGNLMNGVFTAGTWTGFKGTNIPCGVPIPYPGSTAPSGYLLVNGSSFDIAKYPQLGALYPSGNLPDLRGEFIRGWDNGRGVDNGRLLLSSQAGTLIAYDPNTSDDFPVHPLGTIGASPANLGMDPMSSSSLDKTKVTTQYTSTTVTMIKNTPGASDQYGVARPRNISYNYIVRAQ